MCVFPSPDCHSASELSLEEWEIVACAETFPCPLLQRETKEVGEVSQKKGKTLQAKLSSQTAPLRRDKLITGKMLASNMIMGKRETLQQNERARVR